MEAPTLNIRSTDDYFTISSSHAKSVLSEDEITRFKAHFKPAFFNWRWRIKSDRKQEFIDFFRGYRVVEEAMLPPSDEQQKPSKRAKTDSAAEAIKEELHIDTAFLTDAPDLKQTDIAFKDVSLAEFAKKHFRGNDPKEILGQLLFYMHRYRSDCFPQTFLSHNDFRLKWSVIRRGDKMKGKFEYDPRIFAEAKKCIDDPTKRFVIFYLSLRFEDPVLQNAANKLKKECVEYYKSYKVKPSENSKHASNLKFMIKFWLANQHRLETLQTDFLKKPKQEFPFIAVQLPSVINYEESPWKYMNPKPKPNQIARQKLGSLSNANKATFTVVALPEIRYGSPTIKNRTEIEQWFEDNVKDIYRHGHANLIVLDKKTGHYERFEPHGQISPIHYLTETLDKEIRQLFKKELDLNPKNYIPPMDYCPKIGLQSLQEQQRRKERKSLKDIIDLKSGTCVSWSMFYCDLRLRNPDIPRDQLITDAIKLLTEKPEYLTRYIVNFAHFLKDAYDLLEKPEKVHAMLEKF